LAATGALATTFAFAASSADVRADTSSTMTGSVTITGLSGSTVIGPGLGLHFADNQPLDDVTAMLAPFVVTTSVTIRGVSPLNSWYTDTCVDTQTVSGQTNAPPWALGSFDRASGNLTDLPITITVHHSLAAGPLTSFWGKWGCPNTQFPDDVTTLKLSTTSPGGSALDQAGPGRITLTGTGTVTSGARTGTPVAVTATGVLSPLPDRSIPTCVVVPDVRDDSRADADQAIRDAGLNPAFSKDPGNGSYVAQQFPSGGDCVKSGTTVSLILAPGPRP
jgi:hypothetical protein